jgi:hypothetical protein
VSAYHFPLSSRRSLWCGIAVLSPCKDRIGPVDAIADALGMHSAHDRTYGTTIISERKYGLRNVEVRRGMRDTLQRADDERRIRERSPQQPLWHFFTDKTFT